MYSAGCTLHSVSDVLQFCGISRYGEILENAQYPIYDLAFICLDFPAVYYNLMAISKSEDIMVRGMLQCSIGDPGSLLLVVLSLHCIVVSSLCVIQLHRSFDRCVICNLV